jgi:hypothetical protein
MEMKYRITDLSFEDCTSDTYGRYTFDCLIDGEVFSGGITLQPEHSRRADEFEWDEYPNEEDGEDAEMYINDKLSDFIYRNRNFGTTETADIEALTEVEEFIRADVFWVPEDNDITKERMLTALEKAIKSLS